MLEQTNKNQAGDGYTAAAVATILVLTGAMLLAMFTRTEPHPPLEVAPFALGPFLAASLAIGAAAYGLAVRGMRFAMTVALLFALTALGFLRTAEVCRSCVSQDLAGCDRGPGRYCGHLGPGGLSSNSTDGLVRWGRRVMSKAARQDSSGAVDMVKPLALLSLLFSGAMFGFFFAWVCSTMWGLDAADPNVAIAAMQAMNASVRNWVFAPAFFGTPVLLMFTALAALRAGERRVATGFALATLLYVLGAMVPTMTANVPLNEALGAGRDAARPRGSRRSVAGLLWTMAGLEHGSRRGRGLGPCAGGLGPVGEIGLIPAASTGERLSKET